MVCSRKGVFFAVIAHAALTHVQSACSAGDEHCVLGQAVSGKGQVQLLQVKSSQPAGMVTGSFFEEEEVEPPIPPEEINSDNKKQGKKNAKKDEASDVDEDPLIPPEEVDSDVKKQGNKNAKKDVASNVDEDLIPPEEIDSDVKKKRKTNAKKGVASDVDADLDKKKQEEAVKDEQKELEKNLKHDIDEDSEKEMESEARDDIREESPKSSPNSAETKVEAETTVEANTVDEIASKKSAKRKHGRGSHSSPNEATVADTTNENVEEVTPVTSRGGEEDNKDIRQEQDEMAADIARTVARVAKEFADSDHTKNQARSPVSSEWEEAKTAHSPAADLGPKHGGHCTPTCTWSCDKPQCAEECEPVCQAPRCETRCDRMTTDGCSMECSQPHCSVICPKSLCPNSGGCPSCSTKCTQPQCKLQCPKSQPCKALCEQPQCEWKCKAPSSCPKPKCKMICETSKKCQAASFMESLPPLRPGQLSVQSFTAPGTPQEFIGPKAKPCSSMVDVHVRSHALADAKKAMEAAFPQTRMVSLPVLPEADGQRWVPANLGMPIPL